MPPRDFRAFLWDIDHACELLTTAVRENSIEQYEQNEWLRLGVERAFEILAEALTNILRLQPSLTEHITHAPRVIAFRNRITHEYWSTATTIVWAILHDYVPPLQREIQALLAELPLPDEPA
ncbi:MAG: DUF86 domain-containing protein [Thermoanaerobaculia bacterium]